MATDQEDLKKYFPKETNYLCKLSCIYGVNFFPPFLELFCPKNEALTDDSSSEDIFDKHSVVWCVSGDDLKISVWSG